MLTPTATSNCSSFFFPSRRRPQFHAKEKPLQSKILPWLPCFTVGSVMSSVAPTEPFRILTKRFNVGGRSLDRNETLRWGTCVSKDFVVDYRWEKTWSREETANRTQTESQCISATQHFSIYYTSCFSAILFFIFLLWLVVYNLRCKC